MSLEHLLEMRPPKPFSPSTLSKRAGAQAYSLCMMYTLSLVVLPPSPFFDSFFGDILLHLLSTWQSKYSLHQFESALLSWLDAWNNEEQVQLFRIAFQVNTILLQG
jgi:hypothetical protein